MQALTVSPPAAGAVAGKVREAMTPSRASKKKRVCVHASSFFLSLSKSICSGPMNGAQLLRAGRGLCAPQLESHRPRGNDSSVLAPKILATRQRFVSAPERQARGGRGPLLSPAATSVCGVGETSPPSSNSGALALARQLEGIWIANYARSSGRSKLLSAIGLSGLQRVTAEKLIEGVSISVSSSSGSFPSSSSSGAASGVPSSLVANFLTVVPFLNVTEAVPLDGSSVDLPRRDLKPGTATVSVKVERAERGGAPAPPRLVVVSEWVESGGKAVSSSSSSSSSFSVSLRETYKLVKPTELHVEASLYKGGGVSAAAVASSTTVYRLDKAWKPRYSFPAAPTPSFDPFSSPSRRSFVALSSALAASSLLAAAASSAPPASAALPPGLIFPTTAAQKSPLSPIPLSAPLPPAFPRRTLKLPLAVLLLRSCYDALDSSDLVPMDQFQVDFFKIRSDCWEPYLALRKRAASGAGGDSEQQRRRPRPQQGDLSDPAYFDVIAFSQAAAINAEFRKVEESALVARAEAAGGGAFPSSSSSSSSTASGSPSFGSSSSPSSTSTNSSPPNYAPPSPSNVFEFVPSFEEYCEAGVEEGCPDSGRRKVVRSSPLLLPGIGGNEEGGNEEAGGGGEIELAASLWAQQRAAAGDLIYSRIASGSFRGLEFKDAPKPPRTLEEVKEAAEALAGIFVNGGFALKRTVSFSVFSSVNSDEESDSFTAAARTAVVSLRLDGPADLRATGALVVGGGSSHSSGSGSFSSSCSGFGSASSRGKARAPAPAFAGLALGGLLRASEALVVGREPFSIRVVGGGTATEASWRVSERGGCREKKEKRALAHSHRTFFPFRYLILLFFFVSLRALSFFTGNTLA